MVVGTREGPVGITEGSVGISIHTYIGSEQRVVYRRHYAHYAWVRCLPSEGPDGMYVGAGSVGAVCHGN